MAGLRTADGGLTSGAMYSGVPQAVLHSDCVTSSLLYPKSHSLMLGRGCCPSSSTLSSCTDSNRTSTNDETQNSLNRDQPRPRASDEAGWGAT